MEMIREITLKSMNNKIVRYYILENCESGQNKYGIGILEIFNGITKEEKVENISGSKTFVLNLIDYLCDNAVDTAHLEDIVVDFITND